MGEYARSKRTDEVVKIGTCNNMYYMTLPQLFDVVDKNRMLVGNFEKLIFRLPIEEEKGVFVGEFKNHKVDLKSTRIIKEWADENVELFKAQQGHVSIELPLHNTDYGSGLYVGVKCSHGFNEEERYGDGTLKTFYNGKVSHVFSMTGVLVRNRKLYFEIECAICGKNFYLDYEEFKDCAMYGTNKTFINNVIYNLQFDEYYGAEWKELIDFEKLERM